MDSAHNHEFIAWLTEHHLEVRNLRRTCNDGVLVAKILQTRYPRLVELHSYPRCSSFRQKHVNWQFLNKRVLKKVGLAQNPDTLEQLARGVPDAIQTFLMNLMQNVEKTQSRGNEANCKTMKQEKSPDYKSESKYNTKVEQFSKSEEELPRVKNMPDAIQTFLMNLMPNEEKSQGNVNEANGQGMKQEKSPDKRSKSKFNTMVKQFSKSEDDVKKAQRKKWSWVKNLHAGLKKLKRWTTLW